MTCAVANGAEPVNNVMSVKQVDSLVSRAMDTFDVPGIGLGIIKDGKIVLSKGYGVTQFNQRQLVNQDTLFKIASTTKAFTAAALAILVDQGKLSWDTKVVSIIPEFALNDPWVSASFTISDLLTHRSGLARFAGDLMLWPEPAGFSRNEIINNLKHLKSASNFRSEYAYDNLLYIVAGELVPKLSGLSWEHFVEQHIFSPLGMTRCFAGPVPASEMQNNAQPHGVIDGQMTVIKRNQTYDKDSVMAAAGGIKCSVSDLLVWLDTQLGKGKPRLDSSVDRLFSNEQSDKMWQPHTLLPVSKRAKAQDNTNFKAYGLGWRLADVHGYKSVSHTGTLSGHLAYITMIPELDLGVVLLLNQNAYYARSAIMQTLVKSYMAAPQLDWISINQDRQQEKRASAKADNTRDKPSDAIKVAAGRPLSSYVGLYNDSWFGQVQISLTGDGLYFQSLKSRRLRGKMAVRQADEFIVLFDDRTLEADAIVSFNQDAGKKISGFSMDRAYEWVDLSFDYVDLAFTRSK